MPPELSRPLVLAHVPAAGRHLAFEATAEECAALTARFGIEAVVAVRASLALTPQEDGVVLADEELRKTLQKDYPEMWERMQNRRVVMRDNYGINLDESVLPLSDLAGWLPPYALNLSQVFVKGF